MVDNGWLVHYENLPHYQNLHYTRNVMSKRVANGEDHLRSLAPEQHNSEETSQRWQTVADTVPI